MKLRSVSAFITLLATVICLSAVAADSKKTPLAHPLDLNTATAEQLQQVPGIGPSTAKAIVNFRRKSGPFQKIEDLLAIKGVSKARLEKMRPYLTLSPPVQKSP
jgi:competence ComEA-like helix-hairpin-helix protein